MAPFWKPEIIHYGEHHYNHYHFIATATMRAAPMKFIPVMRPLCLNPRTKFLESVPVAAPDKVKSTKLIPILDA
jgi:hypothetical protein